MVSQLREHFNRTFRQEQHQKMLDWIEQRYNYRVPFPIAETPVFVPEDLKNKLFAACEEISDVLVRPDFKALSQNAILPTQVVPGETDHTTFLQMDFGICVNRDGALMPQLIEAQGFPSLYFFQHLVAVAYREHFDIPKNFRHIFGGLSGPGYRELLRKVIVGDCHPENVILLEVEPEKQVTEIDFVIASQELGIKTLCVSKLKVAGRQLYYEENGRKIGVQRIFNRVIFDELLQRNDLPREFSFAREYDVEWIGHPHWFFRISKHTLPLLRSQYVPRSYFLNEIDDYPEDLHNYVLKPLYSFAGSGVMININRHDLDAIKNPENYILQRKVEYAGIVPTLDVPAKCEIRMLMLWERGAARPKIVNNLARLSKGQMVGVRYNKGKTWVGGSVGFFENT